MKKFLTNVKIFVTICIATFAILLTGCGSSNRKETMKSIYSSTLSEVYDFVDPDTGVHYFIYTGYNKAGMSPRYNADGTLMVTPIK